MWIFGNETSVAKATRFVIYCYIHYPFFWQRSSRCVVTKLYNVMYPVYRQLLISIVIFIYVFTQITLWQRVSTARRSSSDQ